MPCSHQSAVTLHFCVASLNIISTLHPRQLAFIAVCEETNHFYVSSSQFQDETKHSDLVDFDMDDSLRCVFLVRAQCIDKDSCQKLVKLL